MMRSFKTRTTVSAMVLVMAYSPLFATLNGTIAAAQATQNSTYTYYRDSNGTVIQVNDPLGGVSTLNYDELKRLKQHILPKPTSVDSTPTIAYTYDGLDQLVTVQDPRSRVTTYTSDGLGNQTSLASPDTGTSNRTYDEAGNLLTSTDARGKVTTYSYDALNRLTNVTYASGTPTVFEYDGGTGSISNAIGRLSRMTDESGQTAFDYDPMGRLLLSAADVI